VPSERVGTPSLMMGLSGEVQRATLWQQECLKSCCECVRPSLHLLQRHFSWSERTVQPSTEYRTTIYTRHTFSVREVEGRRKAGSARAAESGSAIFDGAAPLPEGTVSASRWSTRTPRNDWWSVGDVTHNPYSCSVAVVTKINPLNAQLRAHLILHISRLRVKTCKKLPSIDYQLWPVINRKSNYRKIKVLWHHLSVRFFLLGILRVFWCPLDRLPARRRVSLVLGLPPWCL